MKISSELYPVHFPEANVNLLKPDTMIDAECGSLWVHTDGHTCVSCWKLPFLSRLAVLFTGRIWLGVLFGATQPPVWLTTERPFVKEVPHGKE